jgi:hypothetical protein
MLTLVYGNMLIARLLPQQHAEKRLRASLERLLDEARATATKKN